MSSFKILRDQNSMLSQLSNLSGNMIRLNGSSIINPSAFAELSRIPSRQSQIQLFKMSQGSIQVQKIITNYKHGQTDQNMLKWIVQNGQSIQGVSEEEQQVPKSNKVINKIEVIVPVAKSGSTKKIRRKRKTKKRGQKTKGELKNQTKNIPKNFGKAIISFIEKKSYYFQHYFQEHNSQFRLSEFIEQIKSIKQSINTIADLRKLWIDTPFAKQLRIFSNFFLRRHGHWYVFNSRISNISVHLKYRRRLLQALVNPKQFKHIKDY